MSYIPPAGNAVNLEFGGYYVSPNGHSVVLNFLTLDSYFITALESVSGVFNGLPSCPASLSINFDDVTGIFSGLPTSLADLSCSFDDVSFLAFSTLSYPATFDVSFDDVSLLAFSIPSYNATFNVSFDLNFIATGQQGTQGALAIGLTDTIGNVAADWSAGVFRGTEITRQGCDKSVLPPQKILTIDYLQAAKKLSAIKSAFQPGNVLLTDNRLPWTTAPAKSKAASLLWDFGQTLAQERSNVYSASPNKFLQRFNYYQQATIFLSEFLSGYVTPTFLPKFWLFGFDFAAERTRYWLNGFGWGTDTNRVERSLWNQATPHSWLWGGWHYPPPPPPPIYTPPFVLEFYQPEPIFIGGARLVFGRPCFAWPLTDLITTITDRATIMLHTIKVKRTADNVEVPVLSVLLKFDIESWAWGVTLNLKTPETMALLESTGGEPCEIQIQLDGIYIRALIEEWGETRVFGEHTFQASGRSSLALFAYPYAALQSYMEATEKTAAQLIDFQLLNTGWTVLYHESLLQLFTTDWLIPSGAWSYQNKAPIDCILQIARAVGARAYADHTAKIIHIDPRYPVNPWDWADAVPDNIIPINLVWAVNTHLTPQPEYNHIIVSGQSHGVTVSATIDGTAGNIIAPMITDNLITYVQAGRERARSILCNTGKQARVTIDLPLNSITGLIEPGQLVEVSDINAWRGLVTGINISATHGIISQSVEIERHY